MQAMHHLIGEKKPQLHLHSSQTHRQVTAQMKVHISSMSLVCETKFSMEVKLSLCLWDFERLTVVVRADEQPSEGGAAIPDNKAASFARAFAKIMESAGPGRGLLQVGCHLSCRLLFCAQDFTALTCTSCLSR